MSNIIKKFELFLEKNKMYSDSNIKSIMKEAIRTAFRTLRKKVKECKNVEEVHAISLEIVKEIDALRENLSGYIVLAINENEKTNEGFDVAATLSKLKNTIKSLLHKKTSSLDIAKKEAISRIDKTESDLLGFISKMDIDNEKTNAKIARSKSKIFRSQIF